MNAGQRQSGPDRALAFLAKQSWRVYVLVFLAMLAGVFAPTMTIQSFVYAQRIAPEVILPVIVVCGLVTGWSYDPP